MKYFKHKSIIEQPELGYVLLVIINAGSSLQTVAELFSTVACDEHKAQFSGFLGGKLFRM